MKRIICTTLIIAIISLLAYATEPVTFEEVPDDAPALLQEVTFDENSEFYRFSKMRVGSYLIQVQGESYYADGTIGSTSLPLKLSGEHPSGPNCIWTGEYYYVRSQDADGYWPNPEKYAEPLKLYDENGNEVKRKEMRSKRVFETGEYIESYNQHAVKIGYLHGCYYCQLGNGNVIKSTDFENWEYTDEMVPQQLGTTMIQGDQVSFNQNNFYSIAYETNTNLELFNTLGNWVIYTDEERNFYFTNDNIYFVKVDYPQGMREVDNEYSVRVAADAMEIPPISQEVHYVCEDTTNIIIEIKKGLKDTRKPVRSFRIYIPKEEIYRQLDEMKGAPYVRVADEILGFDTPPVTEADRTLVPMRFLFEKLGADVTWDEATQTATATIAADLDDQFQTFGTAQAKSVSVSIDNTTAVVNGQAKVMDVPARLINDKTMVPLRFLSENLGYTVTWDEATNTAIVE